MSLFSLIHFPVPYILESLQLADDISYVISISLLYMIELPITNAKYFSFIFKTLNKIRYRTSTSLNNNKTTWCSSVGTHYLLLGTKLLRQGWYNDARLPHTLLLTLTSLQVLYAHYVLVCNVLFILSSPN